MSHPIPDAALEADIGVLGQKGSGKSYMTKGLVERLLNMGRRVCILDPLHHWWGLKHGPDGSAGFPLVVIGGERADLPLDVQQGELLGRVVAGSSHSFIIDVSELRRSELITFATDFMEALYSANREALWLIAEEADVFGPQSPAMDGTRKMHDALDQIARRGRQRGFRLWSITQRPARLSKDILTQASTLVLMRIKGPQDRNAAEDWLLGKADREKTKEVIGQLASLKTGEGIVFASDLDLLERATFPTISTLDTSSTPQAGEKRMEAGEAVPIDLSTLREALTVKRSDAPADASARPGAVSGAQYDVIWGAGFDVGYRQGAVDALKDAIDKVNPHLLRLTEAIGALACDKDGSRTFIASSWPTPHNAKTPLPPSEIQQAAAAAYEPPPVTEGLSWPQQKLLNTLVWMESAFHADAITRDQLAFFAEVSHTSSGYQNNLGALRTKGFIEYPVRGQVALTPAGRLISQPPARMKSNEDLQDAVINRLPRPQQVIVNALCSVYPASLKRTDLAGRANVSETSSGFQNNLGRLRSLGLITYPERGRAAAAPMLFPFTLRAVK